MCVCVRVRVCVRVCAHVSVRVHVSGCVVYWPEIFRTGTSSQHSVKLLRA